MDNTSRRGPADRLRVNIRQPHEVAYWCQRFGCTARMLRAAVKAVGVMAKDVERCLTKARRN